MSRSKHECFAKVKKTGKRNLLGLILLDKSWRLRTMVCAWYDANVANSFSPFIGVTQIVIGSIVVEGKVLFRSSGG